MDGVLAIVLPVFGLIGVGWAASRTGLLSDRVGDGLSDFVFAVAVPCLLFKTLATADIPDASPWYYWLSYFTGVAVAWGIASFLTLKLFKRDGKTSVVAGFTSGQGNTVLIGIPLILTAFGDAGKVPIFMLLAIHLPLMMSVATIGIELAADERQKPKQFIRKLALSIVSHPIIIGIGLGVLWRFGNLPLGGAPLQLIESLGSTAVPCALFSSGMALKRYGLIGDLRITCLISFLKLLIHPAVYYVLARYVFALPPVWIGAGLLFAACPSGINAYLLASRYGTGIRIASSSIALSTVLAVLSVSVWLVILDVG
jgi:malonate transporter